MQKVSVQMRMLLSKKPMAFPKTKTSEDVFKGPSKNEEKQLQARNNVVYKYRVQLIDGYLLPDAIYPHWVVTFGSSKQVLQVLGSRKFRSETLPWRTWNETTQKKFAES